MIWSFKIDFRAKIKIGLKRQEFKNMKNIALHKSELSKLSFRCLNFNKIFTQFYVSMEAWSEQMGWNTLDHTTDTSSLSNIRKRDTYGPFNIAGGSNLNRKKSFWAKKVVSYCPSVTGPYLKSNFHTFPRPECSRIWTIWWRQRYGFLVGISTHTKKTSVVIRGNINAERYLNDVLATKGMPLFKKNAVSIFQQDNAHPHAARNSRSAGTT